MDVNEILTYLGVLLGGIILTLAGYAKKPKQSEPDMVVTGVGVELGNRMQVDQLIGETKRCADYLSSISASMAVLADQKQAAMEDKVDEIKILMERLAEKERQR